MNWLKNNVNELFAMKDYNYSKESINNSFESSLSELKKKVKRLKRTVD